MKTARRLSAAILAVTLADTAVAAEVPTTCLPSVAVPMMVRIGTAGPVTALLEGGMEVPLRLFESRSRRLLWSASAGDGAVQMFEGLDAPITGSVTAIDLDGDGLQDRIYAGDMAARLWRFDLHHGMAAGQWVTGGIFADFSNTDGRGFLAPPDVSLAPPAGGSTWLNISLGTAAPGNASASNRFYVLRDHAVHGSWNSDDYAAWQPLREEQLTQVAAVVQAVADAPGTVPADAPGWYVELGHGHVITPTLTVHGRAILAIADAVPGDRGSCEVLAHTASVDLRQPRVIPGTSSDEWRTPLAEAVPADARFSLGELAGDTVPCTLGRQRIAACDVDTRPRPTWWRRMDAE